MARSAKNYTKSSFISINPSPFFHLLPLSPLNSLLFSPKNNLRNLNLCSSPTLSVFYLSLLFSFTFLGILVLSFLPTSHYHVPCPITFPSSPPSILLTSLSSTDNEDEQKLLSNSVMVPLPAQGVAGNLSVAETEFWKQPDGEGYKPCLDFSIGYRKASASVSKEKRRFLMVVASGGLNQQRNQIVDAVVIARILEAALVIPVLQVNLIWGDERYYNYALCFC